MTLHNSPRLLVAVLGAGLLAGGACGQSTKGNPTPTPSPVPSRPSVVPSPAVTCSRSLAPSGPDTGPESNPPGDIPDTIAYPTHSPPSGRYTVKVPEGWAGTQTRDSLRFTDGHNTVAVDLVAKASAPTPVSARAGELPALAAATPCFELRDVTTVQRRAGSAVLIRYLADARPDPVTGKAGRDAVERYEFWKGGTEAVLTLSGAVGADNVDPWRIVSDSFTWR